MLKVQKSWNENGEGILNRILMLSTFALLWSLHG